MSNEILTWLTSGLVAIIIAMGSIIFLVIKSMLKNQNTFNADTEIKFEELEKELNDIKMKQTRIEGEIKGFESVFNVHTQHISTEIKGARKDITNIQEHIMKIK